MVVRGKSYPWGEIPKSLVSLVVGVLATLAALLSLSSLIIHPMDLAGGFTQETQGRLATVLIGMVAGFGLGMASWMTGCDTVPGDKSQPHWKMCRIIGGLGIGFGVLAMLAYLTFITFLPAILPIP